MTTPEEALAAAMTDEEIVARIWPDPEQSAADWLLARDHDGTFKLRRPTIGEYCEALEELRVTRDTLAATGAAPLLSRRLTVFLDRAAKG